jgi:hypothetical protein
MVQTLFNCGNLVIVVQSASSASGLSTSAPQMYNNGVLNTGSYSPGTPGDLMVVQIGYPWFVVSGPLGFALSNLPNGKAGVWGVAAFRVEPYSS